MSSKPALPRPLPRAGGENTAPPIWPFQIGADRLAANQSSGEHTMSEMAKKFRALVEKGDHFLAGHAATVAGRVTAWLGEVAA